MTAVFADTSYFIGLLNPTDQLHASAIEWSASIHAPIVVTEFIFVEVANFLAETPSRARCVPFLKAQRADPLVQIVPATSELVERGLTLYADRSDQGWSLTDCISFIIMNERRMTEALTGDHHFEQAGFKALLRRKK